MRACLQISKPAQLLYDNSKGLKVLFFESMEPKKGFTIESAENLFNPLRPVISKKNFGFFLDQSLEKFWSQNFFANFFSRFSKNSRTHHQQYATLLFLALLAQKWPKIPKIPRYWQKWPSLMILVDRKNTTLSNLNWTEFLKKSKKNFLRYS